METVHVECYLVIGQETRAMGIGGVTAKGRPSVRVSKTKPNLGKTEVPIRLVLKIPIALFTRPELSAALTIPAERVPFQISPDVTHNIAEIIRQETGFHVEITARPPN